MSYNVLIILSPITCANCGIVFGVPDDFEQRRREDHKTFTCPMGHNNYFSDRTEVEKLRDELTRERSRLDQARAWAADEERGRIAAEHRVRAHKGVVTKLRKRVALGSCPCCHRKFKDLRDHMREQHPDWNPEQGAEAIAAKAR